MRACASMRSQTSHDRGCHNERPAKRYPRALQRLGVGCRRSRTRRQSWLAGGAEPPGHCANLPVIVRSQLIDSGTVKTVADLRGRRVALNGKGIISPEAIARSVSFALGASTSLGAWSRAALA